MHLSSPVLPKMPTVSILLFKVMIWMTLKVPKVLGPLQKISKVWLKVIRLWKTLKKPEVQTRSQLQDIVRMWFGIAKLRFPMRAARMSRLRLVPG